jgi:uncharacterized protein (DUF1697 family)
MKFRNVETFIASGRILFDARTAAAGARVRGREVYWRVEGEPA